MDTLTVVTWRAPAVTAKELELATLGREARDRLLGRDALPGAGYVFIGTCQRVLWAIEGGPDHARRVRSWYERSGVSLPDPEVLEGFDAFRHLAEVASSLDSLVPGEPQVLGQVKSALAEAEARKTVTPALRHVFDHALRTAKAVRSSSTLFRGRVSLLPLVEHALLDVLGAPAAPRIAVLGTGEMAGRVRRMLRRSRRDADLVVVSREEARAQAVAGASGCRGMGLQAFRAAPPPVDAIVTAVETDTPILLRADLRRLTTPVTIVDLGMPRNVERPEPDEAGVRIVQLDELVALREHGLRHREQAMEEARRVLEDTLDRVRHEFELRCQASELRLLAHRFDQVAQERWSRAGLDRADPRLQKWYDQTVRALLHEATVLLKEKGAR